MAIQIFPKLISPAAVGYSYQSEPIMATGGQAPYVYNCIQTNGAGLIFSTNDAGQGVITGLPLQADQYNISQSNFAVGAFTGSNNPSVLNPSTFVVTATDSLAATGTITYTLPIGLFSEDQCISIAEFLRSTYNQDWYLVMSDMGTRNIRIGDIGNAAQGGLRLMINSILSMYTQGMVSRMRFYLKEWDRVKLLYMKQVNGGVEGVSGVHMDWARDKKTGIIELMKTMLPAFSRAEIIARQNHMGGSDFTGTVTRSGGNASNVVIMEH